MAAFGTQPIVIDNGTGVIKYGFAGAETPKLLNNVVGYVKHQKVMAGALEATQLVDQDVDKHRGILKLHYPMERGQISDYGEMELMWDHCFNQLEVVSGEHGVLLTESPSQTMKGKERVCELLFETFKAPSVFLGLQAVLALYASGTTTGVVLSAGDGSTHTVPIFEGFAMPNAGDLSVRSVQSDGVQAQSPSKNPLAEDRGDKRCCYGCFKQFFGDAVTVTDPMLNIAKDFCSEPCAAVARKVADEASARREELRAKSRELMQALEHAEAQSPGKSEA